MIRSARPPQSRREGMTLVEVAITTSLLTLLIVPIYGLLYQSRQTVAEAKYESVARLAIEHHIDRLRAIGVTSEEHFQRLAQFIDDNPTFVVAGLPKWGGGAQNGRVRLCLDETAEFFTDTAAAHDDYFACPPYDRVKNPAYQLDLDASFHATSGVTLYSALGNASLYRILPIRVEVFWGPKPIVGTNAGDRAPKVVVNTVIAPRTNFRRG